MQSAGGSDGGKKDEKREKKTETEAKKVEHWNLHWMTVAEREV